MNISDKMRLTFFAHRTQVTCMSEVPAFHIQGAVLERVSAPALLHVVLFCYTLRLGLYPFLSWCGSPWWVLPIELLHGITFAYGWGVGTVMCKRLAPPGLEATMQGIFSVRNHFFT